MFSIPIRQLFCSAFMLFSLIATIVYVTNIDNVKLLSIKIEKTDFVALDERNNKIRNELNQTLNNLIKGMPIENDQWCERMISGDLSINEIKKLKEWKFNEDNFIVKPPPDEDDMNQRIKRTEAEDKCLNLRKLFYFHNEPLSEEENDYPLAYAMVTHKSVIQTMTMISSVYQPQNAYCIVVDDQSSNSFLRQVQMLSDCFKNIFVMNVGKIQWCKYGVVRSVFSCLKYLTEKNHNWKYFQYMSGVDLPLKTNLEMVRIFKQLNGTINADVLPFEGYRIRLTQDSIKPPIKLWKSSLSALISREAANEMVKSDKVKDLLNYLQYTWCSDESLWATIAGNPTELNIPGGFDSASIYKSLLKEKDRCIKYQTSTLATLEENKDKSITPKSPNFSSKKFKLSSFYISRYQLWNQNSYTHPITRSKQQFVKCNGKFVKVSCVFGVEDLPNLINRPELVVHKMYMDFEPAAYFCLWKNIRERALNWREQKNFNAEVYSQLPSVRISKGDPEDQLKYFFDDICHLSISGK